MSVEQAMAQLEAQIATYGQGTKVQPAEGTTEWYLLRAYMIGLQGLRKLGACGSNPAESERVYRKFSQEIKSEEIVTSDSG